jgi:hypothetical protein
MKRRLIIELDGHEDDLLLLRSRVLSSVEEIVDDERDADKLNDKVSVDWEIED